MYWKFKRKRNANCISKRLVIDKVQETRGADFVKVVKAWCLAKWGAAPRPAWFL
jgi:hypothetical protein